MTHAESHPDPVIVAKFAYRHEAELALGYLLDAELNAALMMDDAGASDIGIAFVSMGRLMVAGDQVERAVEVLTDAGYGDQLEV